MAVSIKKVNKTGCSLYVTIPKLFWQHLGVILGDYVEAELHQDCIVIKKLKRSEKPVAVSEDIRQARMF